MSTKSLPRQRDIFVYKLPSGEIVAAYTDETERKQAEQKLVKNKDRLKSLVQNMPVMMDAFDENWNIVVWNKECERVTGYSEDEMINNPDAINQLYPDKEQREKNFSEWMKRGNYYYNWEWDINCKDGTIKTISWSNISERFPISGWATWGVGIDVSEQKRLEKQLIQSQKMEAIGTLAGGIAHDFNNILFPIVGYTEMVMEDMPEDSLARMNMQEILKAAKRARDMVQQILTFSRQSKFEFKPFRLQSLVLETIKLIRSSIPANIEITYDINKNCRPITGDPSQIHQVLMNLCTNAYQAMRKSGGTLEVNLTEKNINDEYMAGHSEIEPGTYAKLTVRDSGRGIKPYIVDRIFDPYFTTKGPGKGTGLGLSVSHGIIKSHGGDIWVSSKANIGSTFNVFLPIIDADTDPDETDTLFPESYPKGVERILLVDDEKANVLVFKQMLESLGYKVTGFTNSIEAAETFKNQADQFDLVITDMTMPKMSGEQLTKKIMDIKKEVPIVLFTGYSDQLNEERAKAIGVRAFMMKPISKKKIATVIRDLLDEVLTVCR